MNLPYRQRGLSALGMLFVLLVAVFFGTCVIKLAPAYMESKTVQRVVEATVESVKTGEIGSKEAKGKMSKLFQVNMVDIIKAKDIKVVRKNGVTSIDARYERRVPLMFNIDVVLKFDNLFYEFTVAPKGNG